MNWLYYRSALAMPLWWQWQWNYVMRARFYFEQRTPDSWPWKWTMFDPENPDGPLVGGIDGTPIVMPGPEP